jgi:hypothetical protein
MKDILLPLMQTSSCTYICWSVLPYIYTQGVSVHQINQIKEKNRREEKKEEERTLKIRPGQRKLAEL